MNCRGVNSGSVRERCGGRVISARLRHYDAAPYLTMLLFCKRSAAGWAAGKREGARGRGEGSKESLRDEAGQE